MDYADKLSIEDIKNLKEGQRKMTHMLKVFDKICRKHNLKYWCTSGTLIGVLRHKGWIPWDADLDVAMLEEDIEIFKNVSKDELKLNNLWLQDKETDSNYTHTHTKIRELSSCYLNCQDGLYMHNGLQLDIFPYKYNKELNRLNSFVKFRDLKDYDYDLIFPRKEAYFENIKVYIPNKFKEYSKLNWTDYPPPMIPKDKRYFHEGNKITPFKTCNHHYKLYPDMYKQ